MKANLYIGLAATALALASCAQDDVIESAATSDANAIRFTTTSGRFSRAAELVAGQVDAQSLQDFDVWASTTLTGEQFIIDQNVSTDGSGVFTFTDRITRYWPMDESLTFAAYRNDQGTFNGDPLAPEFTNFEVEPVVAEQNDLVYATCTANRETGLVELDFKHALSQVLFKARVTNPTMEVVIREVKLGQIDGRGTFDLAAEKWTATSAPTAYTITSETDEYLAKSDVYTPISSLQANTMLVLPQELTPWSKTTGFDGAYIGIDCEIYNVVVKDGEKVRVKMHDGYTYLPLDITLTKGMRYNFCLSIGDGLGGWDENGQNSIAAISLKVTTTNFKDATHEMSDREDIPVDEGNEEDPFAE